MVLQDLSDEKRWRWTGTVWQWGGCVDTLRRGRASNVSVWHMGFVGWRDTVNMESCVLQRVLGVFLGAFRVSIRRCWRDSAMHINQGGFVYEIPPQGVSNSR